MLKPTTHLALFETLPFDQFSSNFTCACLQVPPPTSDKVRSDCLCNPPTPARKSIFWVVNEHANKFTFHCHAELSLHRNCPTFACARPVVPPSTTLVAAAPLSGFPTPNPKNCLFCCRRKRRQNSFVPYFLNYSCTD